MKYSILLPNDIQLEGPQSLVLLQSIRFTQGVEEFLSGVDGGKNDSEQLRSLALGVFFSHNTFAVSSDMLFDFLSLRVGGQARNSFLVRSKVQHLKIDVKFAGTVASREIDHGDEIADLLNCPSLRSVHVLLKADPEEDYLNHDFERNTVQIWNVLEALKPKLGRRLTVAMKGVRHIREPYFPGLYTQAVNLRGNQLFPVHFRYTSLVPRNDFRENKFNKDVSFMWEAPTDAVKNKYLGSRHNWMEELNVLMFDKEANKEARRECDKENLPLTENMVMLKARPKLEGITQNWFNQQKFRNSLLVTREAYHLVRQRF